MTETFIYYAHQYNINGDDTMAIEIKDLKVLGTHVNDCEKALAEAKISLKREQSQLFLTVSDEEIKELTGKPKVTQKERETFVDLKTLPLVEKVNEAQANLKTAKCDFEIALLEFKQSSSNFEVIKALLG